MLGAGVLVLVYIEQVRFSLFTSNFWVGPSSQGLASKRGVRRASRVEAYQRFSPPSQAWFNRVFFLSVHAPAKSKMSGPSSAPHGTRSGAARASFTRTHSKHPIHGLFLVCTQPADRRARASAEDEKVEGDAIHTTKVCPHM